MRTSILLAALVLGASAPAFADERDTTPAASPNAPGARPGELRTGSSEAKPSGEMKMKDMKHDAMAEGAMPKEMFTTEMVLNKIHAINTEEIAGGKLAKTNGDKKVQGYAERMVKDHTKADKDLMTLAEKKNVTLRDPGAAANLPQAEKDKMAQDKAMMDEMKTQKGPTFDHSYLSMMAKGHAEALEFLQQAKENLTDADVKSFVGKIEPVVKDHKKMADALLKGESKVQGRR